MKIPSLFTRVPKYQRFQYQPRHYDPTAEKLRQREEKIKHELALETESKGDYRARMAGSFHSARKQSGDSKRSRQTAAFFRLGLLLYMVLLVIGYLQWGSVTLYSLLLFVPVYFFLKFKKTGDRR